MKGLFLITNRKLFNSDEDYFKSIYEAVRGGVNYIIFREKEIGNELREEYYLQIENIVKNSHCKIIINSDLQLYKKYGGILHLTFKDFCDYKKEKGERIGVSVHSYKESLKAAEKNADYLLFSNIYETECKIGKAGVGLESLKEIASKIEIPIIALGGITEKRLLEVKYCGVNGVAMMSSFAKEENICEFTKRCISKLE